MKVVFYYRSPKAGFFSVERFFESVRALMPSSIQTEAVYSSFFGISIKGCLANIREAKARQGDVNHITGDIYYVALGLDPRKTINTVLDLGNLARLKGIKRWIFKRYWFTVPVRRSRIVTVISEYTKEDLLRHVPCDPAKLRVIYVSLNEEFVASPKPFNKEKPMMLMIGTAWNKNFERQIAALEGIPCHVNLVGKPADSVLEAFAKHKVEHTTETGLSDLEMLERYNRCDVVMFASLLEGFGMPIVEANAVGRAVITSNCTSMPEIAGDAAMIVDPENVASIREAVLTVINDDARREQLIAAGFENAKRFDVHKIAEQYAEIYREVAGIH